MSIQSYRDLDVWKKSMGFSKEIYFVTEQFPNNEKFELTRQLRRSIVSIPSNIAEGHARRTTREFLRFINIAYGSMAEAETQMILASELGYLPKNILEELLLKTSEIGQMLNGLMAKLQQKLTSPDPRIQTPDPLSEALCN